MVNGSLTLQCWVVAFQRLGRTLWDVRNCGCCHSISKGEDLCFEQEFPEAHR